MPLKRPYRLVWFQHFHKAGGSSVIQTALRNGERLYPQNRNGNPVDLQNRDIPIWTYDAEQQRAFVDHCEDIGVSFIASEWGCQDFVSLRDDPRVITISFLRDPWERLVSNYRYDVLWQFSEATSLSSYYCHHSLPYRRPEYYTYALSIGLGVVKGSSDVIAEAAQRNFSAIDFQGNLHDPASFQTLCDLLGWKNYNLVANKAPPLWYGSVRRLGRGDLGFIWRKQCLARPSWTGIEAFRPEFEQLNPMDRALFNSIKGTHKND